MYSWKQVEEPGMKRIAFFCLGGLLSITFAFGCGSADKERKESRPYTTEDRESNVNKNSAGRANRLPYAHSSKDKKKPAEGAPMYPSYAKPEVKAPGDDTGDIVRRPHNTETYDRIYENSFLEASKKPLSTFSIDVDTASYSNMRRFLNQGQLPPKDAVRMEELINYFSYNYPSPTGADPFSVSTEISQAPWNPKHRLVHIGLVGKRIDHRELPPRNLVFLLDVSGSMTAQNKLPLLKKAMGLLVNQLTEKDRVSIAVYAGASGLVLPPTRGNDKNRILGAMNRLRAGGSTNGAAGIQLAYQTARQNFVKNGINRVILCTDGDFNVGTTNQGDLTRLIEKERQSGVFLTVLGFGMGNYKDSTMEKLADKGNGNYAYIDNFSEARKVLVNEAGATLITIAKDVKIQVEFNPRLVKAYRLIGYENRVMKAQDFNNDKKDAGEIGAGHTVTALYEVVPVGVEINLSSTDPLRYQPNTSRRDRDSREASNTSDELLFLKVRYKQPQGRTSKLLTFPIQNRVSDPGQTSANFRFSAGVATFGLLIRDSQFKGDASFRMARELAEGARGRDQYGYRAEFIRLIEAARSLKGGS